MCLWKARSAVLDWSVVLWGTKPGKTTQNLATWGMMPVLIYWLGCHVVIFFPCLCCDFCVSGKIPPGPLPHPKCTCRALPGPWLGVSEVTHIPAAGSVDWRSLHCSSRIHKWQVIKWIAWCRRESYGLHCIRNKKFIKQGFYGMEVRAFSFQEIYSIIYRAVPFQI